MEDVLNGDNRNGTGWTLTGLRVLMESYAHEDWVRKNKPSKGFFINRQPFKEEWDSKEEERDA